jgi:TetR/AcrR family transcriptional regulator, tetracycline repressor protein
MSDKRSAKNSARDEGPLTRAAIVDEAIRLINEDGLEGVSLRRLAARLDVKAASLYWHFKDKADLLAGMAELTFLRCLDSVPAHREWPTWMRAYGKALWRAQRNTRDFSQLLGIAKFSREQFQRISQRIRDAMEHLDLPEKDAMRLQSSIQALVTGWAVFAGAPYAEDMQKEVDFDTEVMRDMDLLIDGEQMRLQRGAVQSRARSRK